MQSAHLLGASATTSIGMHQSYAALLRVERSPFMPGSLHRVVLQCGLEADA